MRKRQALRVLSLVMAVCLLCASLPGYAASEGPIDVNFSDVPDGAWYEEYVNLCASWGIIDGRTETTFCPEEELTRGEFIKLLCMIGELAPYTMDTSIHWSQPYRQVINDNGVLWGLNITCTAADLNAPITRYEMSVMINNLLSNVYTENPVQLDSPELRIQPTTRPSPASTWRACFRPTAKAYSTALKTALSTAMRLSRAPRLLPSSCVPAGYTNVWKLRT